ncbi:hypothetical protein EDD86DRAFT_212171 [Gorgonomyces haynaldii]|nr:hypothetical protein EDD86DRAFT_212171 [Gorgonomyces haynaldii]
MMMQLPDQMKVLPKFEHLSYKGGYYHVAGVRTMVLHESCVPPDPSALIDYMEQLLKRVQDGPKRVKIVYGTLQLPSKLSVPPQVLAQLITKIEPRTLDMWFWDSDLLNMLGQEGCPPCLRLPNMKLDSNVTSEDAKVLTKLPVQRLELFRPMPRNPWGIESQAFQWLNPQLKALVIPSGRLINRAHAFRDAVLNLEHLEILEITAWNLDWNHACRMLHKLQHLKSLQFVHVGSPDFWLYLPTYRQLDSLSRSPNAIQSLRHLGLHYSQPDLGDISMLVQGIIRCIPMLSSLTLRISRPNDSDYDLFSIPKESLERILQRLERMTQLRNFTIEVGSRMWSSRYSYADELMREFTRMQFKISCPLVRNVSLAEMY